jgi:ABC-type multidrug transport system ATPase subunit
MDLRKHRSEILRQTGAIIERPDLYKYLSAKENLKIFSAISGVKVSDRQIMEQLDKVGLAGRAGSKVKTYSQGMKQRLGIAVALVHDPKLIILDEPTNGLDPQGIADIRHLILHLSRDLGKTMLISSHLLSEVELVADSMLIIDKGKKVSEGKVKELFNPAETIVELKTTDNETAWQKLQASAWKDFMVEKNNDRILLKMHREKLPALAKDLVSMDIAIVSFYSKNSLEDYFLSLTSANQHVEAFKN